MGHSARIIPARAGFTVPARHRVVRRRDHPRSRGVYTPTPAEPRITAGSSPLARGLRRRCSFQVFLSGIIPARAGFTRYAVVRYAHSQDHPRSRGVYKRVAPTGTPSSGSSPLARGLRIYPVSALGLAGIIPARAGFTLYASPLPCVLQDHPRSRGVYGARRRRRRDPGADHPRSRGVYITAEPCVETVEGSSPLARGLRSGGGAAAGIVGIIPARAGFTLRASRWTGRSADHPRSRGVYVLQEPSDQGAAGSSPLARGLLRRLLADAAKARIIPARAGFTRPSIRLGDAGTDHPRSRGVYSGPASPPRMSTGSSPLARGLPPGPVRRRSPRRIIPARAGFT